MSAANEEYPRRTGSAPEWSRDGQPENLLAAATDALDWLAILRGWMREDKRAEMDDARARLARCSIALREWIDKTVKEASDEQGEEDNLVKSYRESRGIPGESVPGSILPYFLITHF